MRENEAQYRMAANTWYNALEKAAARYKEGYTVYDENNILSYEKSKFHIFFSYFEEKI